MAVDEAPVAEDEETSSKDKKKKSKGPKSPPPPWLLPAVLIAAFGLVSVVVGGYISYRTQSHQVSSQRAVATAQDRRAAAGAARLMDVEFRARVADMDALVKAKRYPRESTSLASELATEDRRLVATAMSRSGWASVADATAELPEAQRLLNHDPGGRVASSDLKRARAFRTAFGKAAKALATFGR